MRPIHMLILSCALAASPAAAQMYPGEGITVNPAAAGSRVLLYPGGHYMRLLPPLAQPGAGDLEPIHLHMPIPHRIARLHRHTQIATVAPATDLPVVDTPPPAADTPPRHRKHETGAQEPSAPSTDAANATIPFSFTGNAPAASAAPSKVASAEPPPAQTAAPAAKPDEAGLSKRGEIVFKHDAVDPAPAQFGGLKMLAGDLTSALQAGAAKIMLEAYGGAPGDKGSDARRLSLKRALAIRQVLIDNGVPSTKIDVRAMGGIDDKGNADRVDVYVRAS